MASVAFLATPLHACLRRSAAPSPRPASRAEPAAAHLFSWRVERKPTPVVKLPGAPEDPGVEPLDAEDFTDRAKQLVRSDGGPPRWFTPLECGSPEPDAPLLLYLPGIDGTGVGLIRHHKRLGRMFDVWCLHIPVMDRTPFEGLVEHVKKTVVTGNSHSPNKPIYLVGESLGACLALAVAACNPSIDLVVVLANPATCFCKSRLQSLLTLLDTVPEALRATISFPFNFIMGNSMRMALPYMEKQLFLREALRDIPESSTSMLLYLTFLADNLPIESLYWKLKMLRSASFFVNSCLHAVKAQILLISSGKDQLLPSYEEATRLCNALPNSRKRHFKDSGHTIFLEGSVDLVTTIKGACCYRRSKGMDYASNYLLPTTKEIQKALEQYRWVDLAMSPVVLSTLENGKIVKGLAGIPSEGPAVLVGYHMLLGWEMAPMVLRFLTEKNILPRGIGHPIIFERNVDNFIPDPSLFDIMRIMGAVPASATNFYKLLSKKSFVLLYPGGAREALHRKGEQYKLFWPDQSEFVRMASRFGATIIPFGVVGEDDVCELFLDYDDLVKIPYYDKLLEQINRDVRLRTESTGEVGNQDIHLPALLPKFPGRFYFLFGRPIKTEGRRNELKDKERAQQLYMDTKSDVEKCIAFLIEKREKDPYRHILSRLVYQATQGVTAEVPTFEL